MEKTLLNNEYQRYAIKAAEELGYGKECINKIKRAKSDSEIQRIMKTERVRDFED